MRSITITIKTENAAFEPNPINEIGRILRQLSDNLAYGRIYKEEISENLWDINGNKVGTVKVTQ